MYEFFGIADVMSFIGWLIIFSIGAYLVYTKNRENPEFKYYLPHFAFQIVLAFAFGLVYMFYYENHGDTVFYWQGAKKLNLLFFDNPVAYFQELFSSSGQVAPSYFKNVGYPPSWIYSEENSWFVCKISNFLSFFSFGSYITLNLFFSVIVSWVSWRFFRFANKLLNTEMSYIAFACLFIPTTAFWCGGVSKDAIILCAVYGTVIGFFSLFYKTHQSRLLSILVLLVCFFLLFQVRPFMLLICYLPIFIILTFRINKEKPFVIRFLTRLIGTSITLSIIVLYLSFSGSMLEFSADKILNSAQVIQGDLMNNAGYTGSRYDLGIVDFTPIELIKVIPNAINAALFRPYLWEASNPFMLLNGLENLLMMFLTIRLIFKFKSQRNGIDQTKSDFYIYALFFTIFLAYVVGLTSALFGVLVRFKAPIIPFFLLLLLSRTSNKKEVEIPAKINQ